MNYLDKLKHLLQHPDIGSTIQPGALITWTRGDGRVQEGLVDFLHTDPDGLTWAFVTLLDGGWAAVNARAITHPPVSPDAMAKRTERV